MAAHKLGKLKFRFQDRGLEMRWGDGEVRRIGFGKKADPAEYPDDYDQYGEGGDLSDLDYDGRFSGPADDYEDDYAEDGAYADDGYDDGYDGEYADDYDEEYADDYEDGYDEEYDDGYDGGYEDDEYYDDGYGDGYAEDGEYDDRYSDEDADGGYGEYDDYADGYPEGALGDVLMYVDENDWVTYLLLFLLPPLGIYLLWRRRRFETVMRWVLSAASAVWFIVLIVMLMLWIFGGREEYGLTPGGATLSPASPTATINPDAAGAAVPTVSPAATMDPLAVSPSPTPIGGGAAVTTNNLVWCSASGNYYHTSESCALIGEDESVSQVTLDNARSRSKYECPQCYGGTIYYATSGGRYYHTNRTCSDMSNAVPYSQELATATGKDACPVCVTGVQSSLNTKGANVVYITSATPDKSGILVWCTQGGDYYHLTSSCSGMTGASQIALREALLMGKGACSACCAASGKLVWCTKGGTYYHLDNECSGMENAKQVSLAEALVLGKQQCTVCISVQPSTPGTAQSGQSAEYYVYATPTGNYYHIDSACQGMANAQYVPLSYMLQINRQACPVCCSGANMTVYASPGGTYYHSYATCSGMTSAVQGTLASAMAQGYQRCTKCWGSNGAAIQPEAAVTTPSAGSNVLTATADNIMVYATQAGAYYHTLSSCSGMENASYITLRLAMQAGKVPCPSCAAAAQALVYSTEGGTYYHATPNCSGMQNAAQRTLADALLKGQTACPTCLEAAINGTAQAVPAVTVPQATLAQVKNYTVGTSGIRVYASVENPYFHTDGSCAGLYNAQSMALELALNYGKTACPTCASAAGRLVYATSNGRYYHLSQSCAGTGALAGTLADALACGFAPCPYCVASSGTPVATAAPSAGVTGAYGQVYSYVAGTSGVNVYAAVDAPYYHTSQSHAGAGAVQVTLETALNYGKIACPDCSAVADRTVYAVPGTSYYHSNASCAGSGAATGTFAHAIAMGLQACPNCVSGGGSMAVPAAGPEYAAAATSSVYIDLYSEEFYYHAGASCSGQGMSGGTAVTLQFAKDLGYVRCPYCNPASHIG